MAALTLRPALAAAVAALLLLAAPAAAQGRAVAVEQVTAQLTIGRLIAVDERVAPRAGRTADGWATAIVASANTPHAVVARRTDQRRARRVWVVDAAGREHELVPGGTVVVAVHPPSHRRRTVVPVRLERPAGDAERAAAPAVTLDVLDADVVEGGAGTGVGARAAGLRTR